MRKLLDELAQLSDVVMLTRDDGIPVEVLARLAELAARLSTLVAENPERTKHLHRAAVDLAEAVDAMMRGETTGPEHFDRRAKGLSRFLARGGQLSGG